MKLLSTLVLGFLVLLCNTHAKDEVEKLVFLKKGKKDIFAWSLYQLPSERNDIDLILLIKNTGAKFINLDGINTSKLTFMSSTGKKHKIWYASNFDGIMYRSTLVVHLHIDGPISAKDTYSLHLKKNKDALVGISLDIKGIKLIPTPEKKATNNTGNVKYDRNLY